jgi:hypothetical protein
MSKRPHLTNTTKNKKIKANTDRIWSEWISATDTRNFLMKDPLLDWLSNHHNSIIRKHPQYSSHINKAIRSNRNNFTEFLFDQGHLFENKVITSLCKKLGSDIIIDIGGELSIRNPTKFDDTKIAMNKGIPIIYNCVLYNDDNKTYGIPDLLIRSDWFVNIFKDNPILKEEEHIPAKNLIDPFTSKPPKYHYRVVDIKFSTLHLRVDGIHLENKASFKAYKGQLYIYNLALSKIQGYDPNKAYILGRKWIYGPKENRIGGFNCFEKLGTINYNEADKEYISNTEEAIKWIRDVRKNGSRWDPFNNMKKELYPNMSNYFDYPWHNIKLEIAKHIKEITMLWRCGHKHRSNAHDEGVYKWTDKKCTAEILKAGPKTTPILNKILHINRDTDNKILPKIIKYDECNWKKLPTLEFFVDFETVSDVIDDLDSIPYVNTFTFIVMIGVGYINPINGNWIFKTFCMDDIKFDEETNICTQFSNYIKDVMEAYAEYEPSFYHWGHAERSHWNKVILRHPIESIEWHNFKWVDMLDIFKKEPVVIKGCLKFGLKEIANQMYKYGFIKTTWDTYSACTDGCEAMVGLKKANKNCIDRNMKLVDHPLTKEISKYNEIDCKVLQEIMYYLRENHCE